MKKLFITLLIPLLLGCNSNKESVTSGSNKTSIQDSDMKLLIDNKELNVTWEDNASVKELKQLSKDKITINMHKYSTFEQVGPLGHTITSHDIEMTTSPGDIVLYSSNQIVVFFGTNTWGYTKLGHINLNESELNNLLNKESVTLVFTI